MLSIYVYKVDWVALLNKKTVPMFHEWKFATNGVHVRVTLGRMNVRHDFAMPLGVNQWCLHCILKIQLPETHCGKLIA